MKFILNNEQKLLLIVLDEYYHLVGICKENNITWINYREQIWEKLLKNNGFRQKYCQTCGKLLDSHKS